MLLHVTTSTFQNVDIDAARKGTYILGGIVLGRWAVPAFFMVSGYLLLDPARPFGWKRARDHAWRMAKVLLTIGFAFAFIEETLLCTESGSPLGLGVLREAVIDVLTTHTWDHLWYVYALMFVYLLIPPLEALRDRWGSRGLHAFAIVLFVMVLVVPTMLDVASAWGVFEWSEGADVLRNGIWWDVLVGLCNVLVGDWLRDRRLSRWTLAAGLSSLTAMLCVSAYGLSVGWGSLRFIYMHQSFLASIYAACILLLLRRLQGDEPLKKDSLVDHLAHDSFGIYLLHPVFIHIVLRLVNPLVMPPVLYEMAFFAVVLAASVGATRLLRRVPVVGPLL